MSKKFVLALIIIVGLLFSSLYLFMTIGKTNMMPTKRFSGQTLRVCSGAGLMKPMNELIKAFENETGAKVDVHYGGSAEIFGVLETVCGCDVFIPGAYKYTEDAIYKGYILNDTVKNMTLHIPVIITPENNPKNIKSLKDLAKPGVKIVLGDSKACAIGKVAKKILIKNGIWKNVSKNVISFTPTANQLLIYVTTGQADAAIIWEDMATWAQSKGKIKLIEIPPNQNIIKVIPTAVTICAEKDGHLKIAEVFNKFIASHPGIWEKWGFKPWHG